jgi:hypothetical protein
MLRNSHIGIKPREDSEQMACRVYSIPCQCGRHYASETSRSLDVHLQKNWQNRKQGHLETSKLAQQAYEEGHHMGWNEAKILHTETNSRYRKYKESGHTVCLENPISQPSLEISHVLFPMINKEGNT